MGVYEHKNNVRDHFYCVKRMFELYNTKEQLEKLAKREDVDTICAFEHYRMKKGAAQEGTIDFTAFHPEHFTGYKIPSL